jgi:hypothetical protein
MFICAGGEGMATSLRRLLLLLLLLLFDHLKNCCILLSHIVRSKRETKQRLLRHKQSN